MAGRDRSSGDDPDHARDDEGFLGRWSRRKAETKTAGQTASADPIDARPAEGSEAAPPADERGEPPAFDPSSLPDVESLGPGSDFSPFMQAGVPPALKTKALRKLWRIKPELANLDGLIDYGEDLTGSFKVVDHLKTAYEVGRGFLRDQDGDAGEPAEKTEEDGALVEADMSDTRDAVDSNPDDKGADDADPAPDQAEKTAKS